MLCCFLKEAVSGSGFSFIVLTESLLTLIDFKVIHETEAPKAKSAGRETSTDGASASMTSSGASRRLMGIHQRGVQWEGGAVDGGSII